MGKSKRNFIGFELPFDYRLIKGSVLRKLQADLRQAKFQAGVRAQIIARLYVSLGDSEKSKKWRKKH